MIRLGNSGRGAKQNILDIFQKQKMYKNNFKCKSVLIHKKIRTFKFLKGNFLVPGVQPYIKILKMIYFHSLVLTGYFNFFKDTCIINMFTFLKEHFFEVKEKKTACFPER